MLLNRYFLPLNCCPDRLCHSYCTSSQVCRLLKGGSGAPPAPFVIISLSDQPTTTWVYEQVDDLHLLVDGWTIYHGKRDQVLAYFSSLGHVFSGEFSEFVQNNAEYYEMTHWVSLLKSASSEGTPEESGPCPARVRELVHAWKEHRPRSKSIEEKAPRPASQQSFVEMLQRPGGGTDAPLGWCASLWPLIIRQAIIQRRKKSRNFSSLFPAILISALVCLVNMKHTSAEMRIAGGNRLGYLFLLVGIQSVHSVVTALGSMIEVQNVCRSEMMIFWKKNPPYTASALFFAYHLVDFPYRVSFAFTTSTTIFFAGRIFENQKNPATSCLWVALFSMLVSLVFGGIGALVGVVFSLAKKTKNAIVVGVLILNLFFVGLFVSPSSFPTWMNWFPRCLPATYAYRGMVVASFRDMIDSDSRYEPSAEQRGGHHQSSVLQSSLLQTGEGGTISAILLDFGGIGGISGSNLEELVLDAVVLVGFILGIHSVAAYVFTKQLTK